MPADSGAATASAQPLEARQQLWPAAGRLGPGGVGSGGGGSSSNAGSAPSTPSHACALATVTPPTGAASQGSAGSAETAGTAQSEEGMCSAAAAAAAAGGATEPGACPRTSLQRRIRSFQACVSLSPLVQSALLSLECDGSHPPPACLPEGGADGEAEPPAGLECTLAQLLALHLRAGYAQGELFHHYRMLLLLLLPGDASRRMQASCPGKLPPCTGLCDCHAPVWGGTGLRYTVTAAAAVLPLLVHLRRLCPPAWWPCCGRPRRVTLPTAP